MTSASNSDKKPRDPLAPSRLAKPKKGALPTPKEEIDRANPYVPGSDQASEPPELTPGPPPKGDDKKRG